MRILGVSSGPTDAAAALIEDGVVIAAESEERSSRVPRDGSFPSGAITGCLETSGVDPATVDVVALHQKPWNAFRRRLAADRRRGVRGLGSFVTDTPRFARDELVAGQRAADLLRRLGGGQKPEVVYAEHVMSGAAAAFLPSRFRSAAILVVGEVGGWSTVVLAHGANHRIDVLAEQRFPDSLGALCEVVRSWCGLAPSADLGELARLASLGSPSFAEVFADLVQVNDDGSVTVDARTFRWWGPNLERSRRLERIFGGPPLAEGSPLTRREADLACSLQQVLETALVAMAGRAHELTGEADLCLSGSLAANPITNQAVVHESPFERLWVPPEVGTGGCAVGAALWFWHVELAKPRSADSSSGDGTLGREAVELSRERSVVAPGSGLRTTDVISRLGELGVEHRRVQGPDDLAEEVARTLAAGSAVGWFRGPMELGPLPHGRRCILRAVGSPNWEQVRISAREPCTALVTADRLEGCFDATAAAADLRFLPASPRGGPLVDPPKVMGMDPPDLGLTGSWVRVHAAHPEVEPELHLVLEHLALLGGEPVLVAVPLADRTGPPARTVDQALEVSRRRALPLLAIEDVLVQVAPV